MVIAVSIEARGLIDVRDSLGRVRDKLPRALKNDTLRVTNMYCREMRKEIIRKRLIYRIELLKSIRPIPIQNGYGIPIPVYGHYIDKGTGKVAGRATHIPPFYPIKRWAEVKGINPFKAYAGIKKRGGIRKTWWIDSSIQRGHQRLKEEIKKGEVLRTVKTGGR